MRLIIFFEKYNEIKYTNTDIFLTNNMKFFLNRSINNVHISDYTLCDESDELAKSVNNLFNILPERFAIYRNTFYMRVLRPVYSTIYQIDEIIKSNNIDQLILFGGSKKFFLTLKAGEGEGSKWWYKSSWLLNFFIWLYFKDTIKIKWIKKESRLRITIIDFIRSNLIFYKLVLKKLLLSLQYKVRIKPYRFASDKTPVISIVNLSLQYQHMRTFLSPIKSIDSIHIVPCNCNYIIDKKNTIKQKPVRFLKVIKILYQCLIMNFGRNKIPWKLLATDIYLPQKQIIKSLKFVDFLHQYNMRAYIDTIEEIKIPDHAFVVSNMTFGQDIIGCNEISKYFRLLHINFQYVAMRKMILPQMNLADKYYLYSRRTYELYEKYSDSYSYYLPIKKQPDMSTYKNNIKIIIFTQPDMYTDKYLTALESIFHEISFKSIETNIVVKLHYRQDKRNEFRRLIEKYPNVSILENSDCVENLILSSDLTISMTSSVLFEALMLGKMCAIIDLDGTNKEMIYNNDVCYPEVNFVINQNEQLIDIIINYNKYYEKYKIRYADFINNNSGITDFEDIFKIQNNP